MSFPQDVTGGWALLNEGIERVRQGIQESGEPHKQGWKAGPEQQLHRKPREQRVRTGAEGWKTSEGTGDGGGTETTQSRRVLTGIS